ncbi:MAG: histone deacetylase family protein [Alphaproteobacteria bacterium]|nr:histone deacetylase family protein [Alphaproteobacteria bacterium]
MRVFYSPDHLRHDPKSFIFRGKVVDSPEKPERAEVLLKALSAAGHRIETPKQHGTAAVEAVHDAGYLAFLKDGYRAWQGLPGASAEIVPNVHPGRNMATLRAHPVAQAGWYVADTACPVGEGTWMGALAAVDCALSATEAVVAGERAAYGLCRPPGHHAYADQAGGFCLLNNVAVAAEVAARAKGRVAILDVDVHHGNGTQGIFWRRPDVLFVSLHADPAVYYPFYAGYAEETGADAGAGATFNLPLPPGTGDDAYLSALSRALDRIRAFQPEVLLISLGFDAAADDPLGVLKISTEGFRRIAVAIEALGLPAILIQEGGYLAASLGPNAVAFLSAFER